MFFWFIFVLNFVPSSSGLSVIFNKPNAKEDFCLATIFLFHILQKVTLTIFAHSSKIYCNMPF